MNQIKGILIYGFLLMNFSAISQVDSINVTNAQLFFTKLTQYGGQWSYKNEQFDSSKVDGFSHFLMEFTTDELGDLNGIISGVKAQNQKMIFWKILEFVDPYTGTIVFLQRGNNSYGLASSTFVNDNIRESTFEMTYSNGVKQKHRDVHTFLDENTIRTESEIFDPNIQKWIRQPTLLWKRKL